MKQLAITLALFTAMAGTHAVAAPAPAAAPAPEDADVPSVDARIATQLKNLDFNYEIDEDGDYKMVFDMDEGRSQLVFVRSSVETFGSHAIREIWSPGFRAESDPFPAKVASRLLEDSQESKLGAWVKQRDAAMFVVKIDAEASDEQLSDAIDAATRSADAMEKEITGEDEF